MAFRLELDCSELARAKEKEVNFLESSFFRGNKILPKPSEVTVQSPNFNTRPRPALARFEALNLIVKFGSSVAIEEACASERSSICSHLKDIASMLRQVEQDPTD
ncbi:hypothetical protein H103_06450 [Trichophyton rubrum CBS 288.86]|uniref:Uncharacterized protein n=1 Tax=Trichophyton rubrum CBS 288.86 TaxID=1215330 RepID=A0A022VWH0_TRIRU|nr:hypothetical protein H100_06456 [Trichophyton rubrum MR850]EZF50068.1 hypothetical protein H103_06450 [Trichophyton rubrum CBS 288.86]EZF81994.1 hypothetical protein H110_06445 [Trichophyton rubrum MR1448]EZG14194.1 hypothetical protein H107_06593 [Trichophyton rubrum CBS 202.88]